MSNTRRKSLALTSGFPGNLLILIALVHPSEAADCKSVGAKLDAAGARAARLESDYKALSEIKMKTRWETIEQLQRLSALTADIISEYENVLSASADRKTVACIADVLNGRETQKKALQERQAGINRKLNTLYEAIKYQVAPRSKEEYTFIFNQESRKGKFPRRLDNDSTLLSIVLHDRVIGYTIKTSDKIAGQNTKRMLIKKLCTSGFYYRAMGCGLVFSYTYVTKDGAPLGTFETNISDCRNNLGIILSDP